MKKKMRADNDRCRSSNCSDDFFLKDRFGPWNAALLKIPKN